MGVVFVAQSSDPTRSRGPDMAHVRKSSKVSKQVLVSWNDAVDDCCKDIGGMQEGGRDVEESW